MVRTTVLHKGSFQLDKVTALDFCAPLAPAPENAPNYLGVFRVMYMETDRQDAAQQAESGIPGLGSLLLLARRPVRGLPPAGRSGGPARPLPGRKSAGGVRKYRAKVSI